LLLNEPPFGIIHNFDKHYSYQSVTRRSLDTKVGRIDHQPRAGIRSGRTVGVDLPAIVGAIGLDGDTVVGHPGAYTFQIVGHVEPDFGSADEAVQGIEDRADVPIADLQSVDRPKGGMQRHRIPGPQHRIRRIRTTGMSTHVGIPGGYDGLRLGHGHVHRGLTRLYAEYVSEFQ